MAKGKKKAGAAASRKTKGSKSRQIMDLPDWFYNRRLHMAVLFLWSVLLYANTLTHGYVQDDAIVISDNMFTSEGVEGIPGILQNDTFFGFFKEEGKANLVAGGRYRPLSLVLFAVEVELFGLNPFVSHLINALFYGLTSVVLYLVLLQLLRPEKRRAFAYFVAFAAAMLFTSHPLHTEVVANIKGRDEILALLGSLGALGLTLKSFYQKRWHWSLLAAVIFLLALFSKENAITFLAVVPMALYFFSPARPKAVVGYTFPLLAAALVFLVIRSSILGWQVGAPSGEMMNNPFIKVENGVYAPFTTAEKSATIVYSLGKYVQLLLFPYSLTHDYYPRQVGVMQWSDWRVWLSALVYLSLILYAFLRVRRKDPVSFGILYFLATLSIVSNIFFAVGTHLSERFVYMPSVGFSLIVAVVLYRMSGKRTQFRQFYPALGLLAGLVLLYSVRTVVRNPAWKSNYILFTTDVAVSENSAKLRNAAGGELIAQAVEEESQSRQDQMLREAVGHLQRAIEIHPNYKNAHLLLGNAYYYLEQWEQAIQSYQRALNLDPSYEEAENNLAIAYRDAGRYYGEQRGDLKQALTYLNQAYQLKPNDYETLRLLGVAYGMSGNARQAINFFSSAVEAEPENPDALYNLGSAYYNAGNPEQGALYHQRAIEIDPEVVQRMQGQ